MELADSIRLSIFDFEEDGKHRFICEVDVKLT
jgi:hypothetical protein